MLSFKILSNALKFFPNDVYLWRDMGLTFIKNGEYRESILFFEKAYSLNPKNMIIGMTLANRLTREGIYDRSESIYCGYLPNGDNTDRKKIFKAMGFLYFQAGKKNLSAACFGKAIEYGCDDEKVTTRYEQLGQNGYKLDDKTWPAFLNRLEEVLGVKGKTGAKPQNPALNS